MMKICNKCEKELPLECFYRHSAMPDGYLNQCKECVKSNVSKHRQSNIDKIRAYDKKRSNDPRRKKLRSKITKRRRSEVDGYQKSHNAIIRAIKNGTLIRGNTCQICGTQGKTEGHHFDYHLTLKVIWLCPVCHRQYHLGKTGRADTVRKIANMMLSINQNMG